MPSSNAHHRKHGFRCSWFDIAVLLSALVLSLWLHSARFPLWWIVPMVAGHFFLFCNVFLVWQRWELLWAGVFVLNVAAHLAIDQVDGWSVLLWQTPVTIVVILLQVRSPWYHGIFAERLNPRLPDFLEGHTRLP
jgi:hypothetical protein